MIKPTLTRKRVILAFAIAAIADVLQFPVTAVTATGFLAIPGEIADVILDFAVMAATTALLGFHWALLPSFLVEVIPGLDLLPTWTGCVAYVVWQRKKERPQPSPGPIVDVEVVTDPPAAVVSSPPSLPLSPAASASLPPIDEKQRNDGHA